eukprot:Nk52_evm6s251 gene=Nk52_evmTU6s251
MHAWLSVYEYLWFQQQLRGRCYGGSRRRKGIQECVSAIGAGHLLDVRVGGEGSTCRAGMRVLSSGERKLIQIASEALTDPDILLLDMPTSALDASSALAVVRMLHRLQGTRPRIIIYTIHQPRMKIFEEMDRLCVLSQSRTVYFGPARDLLRFVEQCGREMVAELKQKGGGEVQEEEEESELLGKFQCDKFTNPADFLVDLISCREYAELLVRMYHRCGYKWGGGEGEDRDDDEEDDECSEIDRIKKRGDDHMNKGDDVMKHSLVENDTLQEEEKGEKSTPVHPSPQKNGRVTVFINQFVLLCWRRCILTARDPQGLVLQFFGPILAGLVLGFLFVDVQPSQDISSELRSIYALLLATRLTTNSFLSQLQHDTAMFRYETYHCCSTHTAYSPLAFVACQACYAVVMGLLLFPGSVLCSLLLFASVKDIGPVFVCLFLVFLNGYFAAWSFQLLFKGNHIVSQTLNSFYVGVNFAAMGLIVTVYEMPTFWKGLNTVAMLQGAYSCLVVSRFGEGDTRADEFALRLVFGSPRQAPSVGQCVCTMVLWMLFFMLTTWIQLCLQVSQSRRKKNLD